MIARVTEIASPPRYDNRSLADLVPALTAALAPRDADRQPRSPHPLVDSIGGVTRGVVVLVVDGLGSELLSTHRAAAPTLWASPGPDIDAVFPSTTVASLASIGTGAPPASHGLIGYAWAIDGHDQPLNGLGWRIGLRGGGFDARQIVVPESLQPDRTAFEHAAACGIATTVVLHPGFLDSGLTRAALRGGQRIAARGLDDSLARAVEEVDAADGPALAYAHHPLVDWAGHEHGPDAAETRDAIADVDRALTALRRVLPRDVSVLVTADHGMLDVPESDVLELADYPSLLDGVRVLAGEPRVRQLALEVGADTVEVAARWRHTLGRRAVVLTRDDAMPLFGPSPSDRGRAAVGDLVVLARRGTLVHARVDPHGGRHRGQHGGATAAERLVPLRVVTHS